MQRAAKRWLAAGAAFGVGAVAVIGGEAVLDAREFNVALAQVQDARQDLAGVQDLSRVFRSVSESVEPSVVDVQTRRRAAGGVLQVGNGSGVIMAADGDVGYVATNNHVVENATGVVVTLADGREVDGRVVGTDPKTDLAVVEIRAGRLIPGKWGDSEELHKGDWVLAFGSPFGYIGSMTQGIVSATGRSTTDAYRGPGRVAGILGAGGYEHFIQTDAAINPGNSGGPLVNVRGEVIGINSAIASRSGGFDGIGFAIPSALAKNVFEQLVDGGRVRRGWLGIGIADAAEARAGGAGLPEDLRGVFVSGVYDGTPADQVLRPGDVILALDGKPTATASDLRFAVADVRPGESARLTVWRDGGRIDVDVQLGEQPDDLLAFEAPRVEPRDVLSSPRALGMDVATTPDRDGVIVRRVAPRSPAAAAGLERGDVIVDFNDRDLDDAEELAERLAETDLRRGAKLIVKDARGERAVLLRVP